MAVSRLLSIRCRPLTACLALSSHTNTQHTDGLYGAIVVHDQLAAAHAYAHDGEDLVLLLSDLYNTWSPLLAAKYLSVSSIKHIGSGC